MSTTNIHLLPFSHLQKRGLECRYTVRTHTEEKLSKISNIKIRHFAFFSCKYLSYITVLSTLLKLPHTLQNGSF